MREVLPDVNGLGPFSSADDVVSPLDARRLVLVDRSLTRCLSGFLLSEAFQYRRYKTSDAAVDAK